MFLSNRHIALLMSSTIHGLNHTMVQEKSTCFQDGHHDVATIVDSDPEQFQSLSIFHSKYFGSNPLRKPALENKSNTDFQDSLHGADFISQIHLVFFIYQSPMSVTQHNVYITSRDWSGEQDKLDLQDGHCGRLAGRYFSCFIYLLVTPLPQQTVGSIHLTVQEEKSKIDSRDHQQYSIPSFLEILKHFQRECHLKQLCSIAGCQMSA